jgi:predicted N-formylglutamate amidohydrolase
MDRGENGPAPYVGISPGALGPLVLTCEHAFKRVPGRYRVGAEAREILDSHWGWDIGAWEVTRGVAKRLGTSAVGGRWSRLLIDLNRAVGDPTLIRGVAGGIPLPWNAGLSETEIERRVLAYHARYHAEVDRLILRRVIRGIRPLLLAVHTFTPELDGEKRRFDAGVLFARHATLAHRLGRSLRQQGLTVRYNEPYSGMAGMMYSAERHGSHHGVPCLELELNQGLFRKPSAPRSLARIVARAAAPLVA